MSNLLFPFGFQGGVGESSGTTITLSDNTTDFPDATISTDLVLANAGSHSKGTNNPNSKKYTKATLEMDLTVPYEFTSIGGTASSPTMQNALSGLISNGDELWFKPSGSNALTAVTVGSVSPSGAAPTTYTLSSLTPTQSALPEKVFKIRNSSTAMMYLASGGTNEVLCKDTSLSLVQSSRVTETCAGGTSRARIATSGYDGTKFAQAFQVSSTDAISKVSFLTYTGCTAGAQVNVRIETDSAGSPSGTLVSASAKKDAVTADTDSTWFDATLDSPWTPTASTTYWLVYVAVNTNVTGIALGSTYANGTSKVYSGSWANEGVPSGFKVWQNNATYTSTTQLITQQSSSLLPYFNSTDLNKTLSLTVGGSGVERDWSGTVTETGGLKDYSDTSDLSIAMYAGGNIKRGQAITISSPVTVTSCSFLLFKVTGSPTGTVVFSIYAATGTVGSTAVATGSALVSSPSLDVSTLGGSATWVNFALSSPYSLAAGDYVVCMEYTSTSSDASNYIAGRRSSTDVHAGNHVYYTSSWTAVASSDVAFRLYGQYTTTIPLASATASAATAASIKNKFQTSASINGAVYSSGPIVTITSPELTLSSNVTRLAMKVRGDFGKAQNFKIYNKEKS